MTKIKIKLYIFFKLFFFFKFFSLFWGGTMAHPGPPSLVIDSYYFVLRCL
jgi:hypothetical protein